MTAAPTAVSPATGAQAMDAPRPSPSPAPNGPLLALDTQSSNANKGLVLAVRLLNPAATAYRYVNGVAFRADEERTVIEIGRQRDGDPNSAVDDATRIEIEINSAGACAQWSRFLSDDLTGACAIEKPEKGLPASTYTAEVVVPWSALNELFARPAPALLATDTYDVAQHPELAGVRGPQYYRFCVAARGVAGASVAPEHARVGMTGACSPPLLVVFREPVRPNVAYQTGSESGNGTSQSSSGSVQPSSVRRTRAASAASSAPAPASGGSLLAALAQPLNAYVQLSAEGGATNALLPTPNKQTNTTLETVVGQQVAQQLGSAVPGGIGTSVSSLAFTKIDTDTIGRLMPSAFRGYSDATTTLTNQPQAFDGSDALDLVPFNPSTVNSVTAGVKLSDVDLFNGLAPRLGLAGVGWFHDSTRGASGSIVHLDQDVARWFAFGSSYVVANTVSPPTNVYVAYHPTPATAGLPTPVPSPVLHSTNAVIGTLFRFGNPDSEEAQPVQVFTRFASNGLGRDVTAAVSASGLGAGRVVNDDGSSFDTSLLGGYRAIDAAYTPLFTTYNPLSGNQVYFGRLNFAYTRPTVTTAGIADRSKTQTATLSLSGIVAGDGGRRAYGSFGVSPSVPLAQKNADAAVQFSITGSYLHSFMASTVYARQTGTVVIPPDPLNLLNNDATTLSLQVATPDNLLTSSKTSITATAGVAALHSPTCSTTTLLCSSPFTHKVTWTLNAGRSNTVLYVDSEPGTTRSNPTSVSPSIPSSAVVTTALVANHFCVPGSAARWGFEPSLTYKNNVSQDGAAFQPGTLLQAGLDVGPAAGIKWLGMTVISLSYQNAVNARGVPVALKGNAFGVQLTSASQAMWQAHKSKGDPCLTQS
ncbi:MAG TPA: hypothetical protein VHT53_04550 [Candidatus Elarobacter sp.]|nr:hypothetical protein [Candidatus Elarobacter sp.]